LKKLITPKAATASDNPRNFMRGLRVVELAHFLTKPQNFLVHAIEIFLEQVRIHAWINVEVPAFRRVVGMLSHMPSAVDDDVAGLMMAKGAHPEYRTCCRLSVGRELHAEFDVKP
jgi:hypothetical protein